MLIPNSNLNHIDLAKRDQNVNSDPKKQAQEAISLEKKVTDCHLSVFFNDTAVEQPTSQKHLDIHLYEKLGFNALIKTKVS